MSSVQQQSSGNASQQALETLMSDPAWRLSGFAPLAGGVVGSALGGLRGLSSTYRKRHKHKMSAILQQSLIGGLIGGGLGAFGKSVIRAPMIDAALLDVLRMFEQPAVQPSASWRMTKKESGPGGPLVGMTEKVSCSCVLSGKQRVSLIEGYLAGYRESNTNLRKRR
jgi:hypothetical protein